MNQISKCVHVLIAVLAADWWAGAVAAAGTNRFEARDGAFHVTHNGGVTPMFVHAMNLGVGVPGTEPGELAATQDQYARWLARIGSMGLRAVRVYTLHYPRFYEALRNYNLTNSDAPIYLFQGIWLEEKNPALDLHALTGVLDTNITEAVWAVHGQITLPERLGQASGVYTADVSPWVLGWILGREIAPAEVAETDAVHTGDTNHVGRFLSLPWGTPAEVWVTARLDFLAGCEHDAFGEERPISFSSWPTLDPLTHPTESQWSYEDTQAIDLANLDTSRFAAGFFASYHAYPYYPDFISEEPGYRLESDADGPNSYLGYLKALRAHYFPKPLLIAEFGVPSSWGNAHVAHSGMHQGGHDEVAQGRYAVRMFQNIAAAGCAGGALFAWIDEWWKNSWITEELDFPLERRPFWLNATAPEENFGLVAFEESAPTFLPAAITGWTGPIQGLTWTTTHRFFQLEITTAVDVSQQPLVIGFDTYRDDLGETILPDGTVTTFRSELALVVDGGGAQLLVAEAYDLFGIWHGLSEATQLYQSIATNDAPWKPVRWLSNPAHRSDDGVYQFPATVDEIGRLRVSSSGTFATALDAVGIGGGKVRLRLPWTLLQFTDPSRAMVMHDDRSTPDRETAASEGVRVILAQAGALLASDRLLWAGWESAPQTTEREKASVAILENYLLNVGGSGEIRIRIVSRVGDLLLLDWTGGGLLYQASTPEGAWTAVGQGSPTTVTVDPAAHRFFKVRR